MELAPKVHSCKGKSQSSVFVGHLQLGRRVSPQGPTVVPFLQSPQDCLRFGSHRPGQPPGTVFEAAMKPTLNRRMFKKCQKIM